jgi:hypothetical protein
VAAWASGSVYIQRGGIVSAKPKKISSNVNFLKLFMNSPAETYEFQYAVD